MLELNCFEKTAINIFKQGQVPQHIGFIMDGNRRYGKLQKHSSLSGHEQGTRTLKKCLLYCLQLGVKYASFYAFSIQNFNRKSEQVNFLMDLARKQFQSLSQIYNSDNLFDIVQKNNVKVKIIGDLDNRLKQQYPDVRDSFASIQQKTKQNTKMTMFICFAYDSIYQINNAFKKCEECNIQNPTKEQIFQNLLIPHPVDLLIRTSNQSRLSNFLLLQSENALIQIQKNFWPAFNLFILIKILLKYNVYAAQIKRRNKKIKSLQKIGQEDKQERKLLLKQQ